MLDIGCACGVPTPTCVIRPCVLLHEVVPVGEGAGHEHTQHIVKLGRPVEDRRAAHAHETLHGRPISEPDTDLCALRLLVLEVVRLIEHHTIEIESFQFILALRQQLVVHDGERLTRFDGVLTVLHNLSAVPRVPLLALGEPSVFDIRRTDNQRALKPCRVDAQQRLQRLAEAGFVSDE